MAIAYTWNITRLEYYPSKDGFNKVVNTIHWTYTAVDGVYESYVYGSKGLETDTLDPTHYTAYDNLTEEMVIGWLTSSMGDAAVAELQTTLRKMIDDQRTPPNVIANPPWYQDPISTGNVEVVV